MQQASQQPPKPLRIEKVRQALNVFGLAQRFDAAGAAGIPGLWQRLGTLLDALPGQTGTVAYGVISDFSQQPFSYQYLAGVELPRGLELPEGFSSVQVPSGNYAVFEHSGHVSTLPAFCNAIWSRGLSGSELEAIQAATWFEKYDESFDPKTGLGVIEVWIPIHNGEQQ